MWLLGSTTALQTMGFFELSNTTAISAPGTINLFTGDVLWGEKTQYEPGYAVCNIAQIGTDYVITSSTGLLRLAENGTLIDSLQLNYTIVTMSAHPATGIIYAAAFPHGTTIAKTSLLAINLDTHSVFVLIEQISSASGVVPCASMVDYTDVFVYVLQEAAILHKVVAYNIRENTTVGALYSGWIESVAPAVDGPTDSLIWMTVNNSVVGMDPRYNETYTVIEFNRTERFMPGLATLQSGHMIQPPFLAIGYTLLQEAILLPFTTMNYTTMRLNISDAVGVVGLFW